MLTIVIAPSGFKKSLSAEEAAKIIAKGVRNILPDAEIVDVFPGDGCWLVIKSVMRTVMLGME